MCFDQASEMFTVSEDTGIYQYKILMTSDGGGNFHTRVESSCWRENITITPLAENGVPETGTLEQLSRAAPKSQPRSDEGFRFCRSFMDGTPSSCCDAVTTPCCQGTFPQHDHMCFDQKLAMFTLNEDSGTYKILMTSRGSNFFAHVEASCWRENITVTRISRGQDTQSKDAVGEQMISV